MKSQRCNGYNRYYNGVEKRDYEGFYLIVQEKEKSRSLITSTSLVQKIFFSPQRSSGPILRSKCRCLFCNSTRSPETVEKNGKYDNTKPASIPIYQYISITWRRLEPVVDMQRYIVYFWLYCGQEWNFKLTELGFVQFEYNSFRCFGD